MGIWRGCAGDLVERAMNFPEAWQAQMEKANYEVNELPYRDDAEHWGELEFWANVEDTGKGDCEDYAIGKLRRLVALGWPIEGLHLAVCWTELSEYHAVLVVETPVYVGYVLDNRMAEPYPVYQLQAKGYTPDKIQAVGGQRGWREWLLSPV